MNSSAVHSHSLITEYANNLLADSGITADLADLQPIDMHGSAIAWAQSGAMWLTGGKQPVFCSAPLAVCARAVWLALRSVAGASAAIRLEGFDAAQLLSERAAYMGLQRRANISPGGGCRLLTTADSCIAINMARDSDWQQLSALLCADIQLSGDQQHDWRQLELAIVHQPTNQLVEQGRLLGMAIAPAMGVPLADSRWLKRHEYEKLPGPKSPSPLVIDLSSLWAGPLCSHLLKQMGARVIKVESTNRPDGARGGNREFYDLLNGGKQSIALDLKTESGVSQLKQLILQADIVIEGSRPRALRQLGIGAEQLLAAKPGLSWLSITGYGRDEAVSDWVAFGDDAAVAAGLSARLYEQYGQWLFGGDAIADPLTGLHAALAAWGSWISGGGQLLEVSLYGVMAHCINSASNEVGHQLQERDGDFCFEVNGQKYEVQKPKPRAVQQAAAQLGVDTEAVLMEFKIVC